MRIIKIAACAALIALAPVIATVTAADKSDVGASLFTEVFEQVRANYVEPVTDKQLVEGAIKGMLASLDPHSNYMDAKEYREMQVQTRGEFAGLGMQVTMENGLVKIISPIDDTPAAKAGLKPGDFITHIDGEPVLGLVGADRQHTGAMLDDLRRILDTHPAIAFCLSISPYRCWESVGLVDKGLLDGRQRAGV
jgi:carboxyl-terminal processing protease